MPFSENATGARQIPGWHDAQPSQACTGTESSERARKGNYSPAGTG
jgi:hypothetical protein